MSDPTRPEHAPIPPERRVPCPDGWEPVIDTVCGEPAMFVEITHDGGARLGDIRKIWPDGRPTQAWEFAHCGSCGRNVATGSYERNGIRRDGRGVRRLW